MRGRNSVHFSLRGDALRGNAAYSLVDPKSALTLSASLSQGLDMADARSTVGETGFQKMVLQGGYNRLLDEDWVLRLKAITQLAGDCPAGVGTLCPGRCGLWPGFPGGCGPG
jgi:hypothetical protein